MIWKSKQTIHNSPMHKMKKHKLFFK